MSEEIEVFVPTEETKQRLVFLNIIRDITGGIGFWGTLRPLVAVILAAIPFLFLGQHFNGQHRKGMDAKLLQLPLALTVILWVFLWIWSIYDAWTESNVLVSQKTGQI